MAEAKKKKAEKGLIICRIQFVWPRGSFQRIPKMALTSHATILVLFSVAMVSWITTWWIWTKIVTFCDLSATWQPSQNSLAVARVVKIFGVEVWGVGRRDLPKEQRSQYVDRYLWVFCSVENSYKSAHSPVAARSKRQVALTKIKCQYWQRMAILRSNGQTRWKTSAFKGLLDHLHYNLSGYRFL